MDARAQGIIAEAHFNDLQADFEAGCRQLDALDAAARRVRDALLAKKLSQALMGSLMRQIAKLRKTVREQQTLMRQLRHDIRRFRHHRRAR